MEPVENIFDQLILGKLTGQEKENLRSQIETDDALKKKWEERKFLIDVIQYSRKEELKNFINEKATTKLTGNFWSKGWTYFSAVVVILTGIAIFFLHEHKPPATLYKVDKANQEIKKEGILNFPFQTEEIDISNKNLEEINSKIFKIKTDSGNDKELKVNFYNIDRLGSFYQLFNYKLKLFNLEESDVEKFVLKDGIIFMNLGTNFYPLKNSQKYYKLQALAEDKWIKKLQ